MHLPPLLSAIAALCSTQLVVGLPQSPSQERERGQTETYSTGDKFRDGANALGLAGVGLGLWKMRGLNIKLNDVQKGQQDMNSKLNAQYAEGAKNHDRTRKELAGLLENQALAGQESPTSKGPMTTFSEWRQVKIIVKSNPKLARCMNDYLRSGDFIKPAGGIMGGAMMVSPSNWNDAAEACRDTPGYIEDVKIPDSDWDVALPIPYEPPRRRDAGAQGSQEFSVVDKLLQTAKYAPSFFTGSSRKPAVGPVPGGMFRCAGVGPIPIRR